MQSREYDITVWGCTGVVGDFITDYIAKNYAPSSTSLKIALAGRNKEKLDQTKEKMIKINPSCQSMHFAICKSLSKESLMELTKNTKCLIACVGPFQLYGEGAIQACIETQTNYVDITGETIWVSQMILKYQKEALEKGIQIVPSCGMDSVPFDLGALLCQIKANTAYGASCHEIHGCVTRLTGGFSGSTIHSLTTMLEQDKALIQRFSPYDSYDEARKHAEGGEEKEKQKGQEKKESAQGKKELNPIVVEWSDDFQMYTVPFVMTLINAKVVYYTSALRKELYSNFPSVKGKPLAGGDGTPYFRYRESLGVKKWLVYKTYPWLSSLGNWLLTNSKWARQLLNRIYPSGSRPRESSLKNGEIEVEFIGRVATSDGEKKVRSVVATFAGDPGYQETAKMLFESARCALDNWEDRKKGSTDKRLLSGFLTPGAAFGEALADRLREQDFIIKTEVL